MASLECVAGDYARAQASGVTCVPLLVALFGGLSLALYGLAAVVSAPAAVVSGSQMRQDSSSWAVRAASGSWLKFIILHFSQGAVCWADRRSNTHAITSIANQTYQKNRHGS